MSCLDSIDAPEVARDHVARTWRRPTNQVAGPAGNSHAETEIAEVAEIAQGFIAGKIRANIFALDDVFIRIAPHAVIEVARDDVPRLGRRPADHAAIRTF